MSNKQKKNTGADGAGLRHVLLATSAVVFGLTVQVQAQALAQGGDQEEFDIPPSEMTDALQTYSEQADVEIIYAERDVADKVTNGVDGSYSKEAALDEIIEGTDLVYEINDDGVVVIRAALITTEEASVGEFASREIRVAQISNGETATDANVSDGDDEEEKRDVIIVTGTNIRGIGQGPSQVLTFDREDIDKSGFATTERFIQSIPQNFSGGVNQDTITVPTAGANGNIAGGASVNLRGLGSDQTLILINGRRTAPSGINGGFVDISSIGLTAIDRVEVLTDGASAIYGADAIGGVVNFILRDDYDGAETRARYGTVTEGDSDEIQIGQLLGKNWPTGNILLSYEYYHREALANADREFAADSDLTSFGGDNQGTDFSNPGNIFVGGGTFAIPSGQDGTSLTPADFTAGTLNLGNRRERLDLLPEVERHSLFGSFRQKMSHSIELFAEARYTNRETTTQTFPVLSTLIVPASNAFFVDPSGSGASAIAVRYSFIDDLGPQLSEATVEAYGGVVGASVNLSQEWQVEVYGSFAQDDSENTNSNQFIQPILNNALADSDPQTAFNPFGEGSNTAPETLHSISGGFDGLAATSKLWTANLKADGPLFDLPGGSVKLAVGGEFRHQFFSIADTDRVDSIDPVITDGSILDRDIFAAFAELYIPLVSEDNALPGVSRLELLAAGRFEDYSDFGSTTRPKVGVLWSPFEGLNIRGTYGTSFKAPVLSELDTSSALTNSIFFIPSPFVPLGSLILFGNNADLKPETATTWTAGFDYTPQAWKHFNISLNYFDVSFRDRIEFGTQNLFDVYTNLDEFAPIVNLSPTEDDVRRLVEDPLYTSGLPLTGLDPVTGAPLLAGIFPVEAIIDLRLGNIAKSQVSGLDFSSSYGIETGVGNFDISVSGSYLFEFKQALLDTQPFADQVSTIGNPVNLRMRNSVSWSTDAFNAIAFLNYTNSYDDDQSMPARKIDSWTTVDLQANLLIDNVLSSPLVEGGILTVSVQNLFNENPPFVNNRAGVGFDPTNATGAGRFISLQITKQW